MQYDHLSIIIDRYTQQKINGLNRVFDQIAANVGKVDVLERGIDTYNKTVKQKHESSLKNLRELLPEHYSTEAIVESTVVVPDCHEQAPHRNYALENAGILTAMTFGALVYLIRRDLRPQRR